jgi:hypothetical protein
LSVAENTSTASETTQDPWRKELEELSAKVGDALDADVILYSGDIAGSNDDYLIRGRTTGRHRR